MSLRKKILIDTDIGDNMDDAFAIFAAMASGLEIVGITTVFRNTHDRARMAKKLMISFGHGYETVPVFAGYRVYTHNSEENSAYMGLFGSDLDLPEYAPENTDPEAAVDFIIDSCRRYGKELTIIAIGPFCNIAKVIEKDPEALNLAGKVVIMGGAYFRQYADWNVSCDVPAADLMFRSLRKLECLGADVTHRLTVDYLKPLLAETEFEPLPYLAFLYRKWQASYPQESLVLHDALAIYYAIAPGICQMRPIRVAVIRDGFAKGLTLNVDAYNKGYLNNAYRDFDFDHKVLAAEDVDTDLFHKYIRQGISCDDLSV